MTDEYRQREALYAAFDKLTIKIKEKLLNSNNKSFVRIRQNGDIVLMGYGIEDEVIFTHNTDDFMDTELSFFHVYTLQVKSVKSSNPTYDRNISQNWSLSVEKTLLKFQSNANTGDVDVVIII